VLTLDLDLVLELGINTIVMRFEYSFDLNDCYSCDIFSCSLFVLNAIHIVDTCCE
jgi:hypothetical protein